MARLTKAEMEMLIVAADCMTQQRHMDQKECQTLSDAADKLRARLKKQKR